MTTGSTLKKMNDKVLPTEKLLAQIQQNFYSCKSSEKQFYADRRMLLYALTWPGKWLEQRGLPITAQHYEQLLTQRLKAIAQHGKLESYQRYFPGYLLKCLQDWFAHHGDELYEELKHVRNHLHSIEALLQRCTSEQAEDIVTPMAQAHAILMSQRHRKHGKEDTQQLTLF